MMGRRGVGLCTVQVTVAPLGGRPKERQSCLPYRKRSEPGPRAMSIGAQDTGQVALKRRADGSAGGQRSAVLTDDDGGGGGVVAVWDDAVTTVWGRAPQAGGVRPRRSAASAQQRARERERCMGPEGLHPQMRLTLPARAWYVALGPAEGHIFICALALGVSPLLRKSVAL